MINAQKRTSKLVFAILFACISATWWQDIQVWDEVIYMRFFLDKFQLATDVTIQSNFSGTVHVVTIIYDHDPVSMIYGFAKRNKLEHT